MLKNFDKIEFDYKGVRRLGVLIEDTDELIIYCIDNEDCERYRLTTANHITVVGQVAPLESDEPFTVMRYTGFRIKAFDNLTNDQWCRWLAQAPNIACCINTDKGIVLCEVEKPVTYQQVGEFNTKTIPDDDTSGEHYIVLKRSDGQLCINDPVNSNTVPVNSKTLLAYFDRQD